MPLKHWLVSTSTTFLGSLFQCLNSLSVKKCFLMSSLNLPVAVLNHSCMSCLWIEGSRDQQLLLHLPFLESCEEQWGLIAFFPSAFFSPNRQMQSVQLLLTAVSSSPCLSFVAIVAKYLHIFVKLWGPELHMTLQIRLHQHSVKQDNHIFDLLVMLCLKHSGTDFALWATRAHTAGSHQACHPPAAPGPFLRSFPNIILSPALPYIRFRIWHLQAVSNFEILF